MMELNKSNLRLLQRQIGRSKRENYGDIRIEWLLLDVRDLLQQPDIDESTELDDPYINCNDAAKVENSVNGSICYHSDLGVEDINSTIRPIDQTALDDIEVRHHADGVEGIVDPNNSSLLLPVNKEVGPDEEIQPRSQHSSVSNAGEHLRILSLDRTGLNSSIPASSSSEKPPRSRIPRPMSQVMFKVPKISTKNKISKSGQFDLKFPKF